MLPETDVKINRRRIMKISLSLLLSFALLSGSFASSIAQQRTPTAPQQPSNPPDDDEVVRITTNLVQVDAVVTDRQGNHITDLRAEDFEILENGRAQPITHFSYIATSPAVAAGATAAPAPVDRNAPPARLRPEQVRRTIALVVDDLGLSFESAHFVRRALKKFVDEQMQAGDMVAIIRTSAGVGALQQFTADRRQLYAAIERVRWVPGGRGGVSAFAPIESNPLSARGNETSGAGARGGQQSGAGRTGGDAIEEFREEIFTVGTLGALNFIVRGLREMPGRKSVILFSDGIPILNRSGESGRVLESLRRLTDLANRASVVFYAIDARGLPTLGLTAADNTSWLSVEQIEASLSDRRTQFFESQNGLNYLAQQTGGFTVFNNNDLNLGLRRVLNDQRGYYLIGYRPDDATFVATAGRRRFHNLRVRVNRPDLRVRTRQGFYGVPETEARPIRRTRAEQLVAAITTPFGSNDIDLRFTSLFGNEPQAGSFIRSLLSIDMRDFTFTPDENGWQKAVMDIVAITFGDSGQIIDQVDRTETIRVRPEAFADFQRDGLVYYLTVPIRRPGAYQLRIAVRDVSSERIGAASQFIEVPNLRRNRLALSGIVLSRGVPDAPAAPAANQAPPNNAGHQPPAAANNTAEPNAEANAAVRRFRQRMLLDYGLEIYNARLDRATRRPQLMTQVRLFRDGQPVFTGQPQPFDAGQQTDLQRLSLLGRLQLGTNLAPGEYILQVIVTDALADPQHNTVSQWIDFEIVR